MQGLVRWERVRGEKPDVSSEGPENREVLIRRLDEILNVFSNDFGR